MQEEVIPDKNSPQIDSTGKAHDPAENPAEQTDVDDDMDEDEEVCDTLSPCSVLTLTGRGWCPNDDSGPNRNPLGCCLGTSVLKAAVMCRGSYTILLQLRHGRPQKLPKPRRLGRQHRSRAAQSQNQQRFMGQVIMTLACQTSWISSWLMGQRRMRRLPRKMTRC